MVEAGVAELVLVAQDLAWYGRDIGEPGSLAPLLRRLDTLAADGLARVRLLYLYPSEVRDPLVSTMLELPTVVPYFDLSLQHADAQLLRRMKRWGSGDRFLTAIDAIRAQEPEAAFRSSFIVGFPGETEREHDELLAFLEAASLDWAGFFPFSPEDGTPAASLPDAVDPDLALEWMRECEAVQEPITRAARDALVGREIEVLVDAPGEEPGSFIGRTHREAPEIDGIVQLDAEFAAPGRARARARHRGGRTGPLGQGAGDQGPRVSTPPAARVRRYGDEAIATPANMVTIARLVLAVPTLLLIIDQGSSWLTVSLWFVLTTTDGLDGWLARRDGTTRSGAFLDPLADKFLVLGGFFALGINGDFSWAAVLIVTVREVGVSLYRSYAARHGISLPARRLGKWKAFFQFLAVGVVLLPPTYEWATFHDILLWWAVGLSVVSGLDIVISGQRQARAARKASIPKGASDAL